MKKQLDYQEIEKWAIDLLATIAEQEKNNFLDEGGNPIDLSEVKMMLVSTRRSLVRCLDDSHDSDNIPFEQKAKALIGETRNHVLKLVQERIESMPDIK
jgi:hypothetical protein